jgi:cell division protease FtsH
MDGRHLARLRARLTGPARSAVRRLRATDPGRRRRWALVTLATVAVVLMFGAGFAVVVRSGADSRPARAGPPARDSAAGGNGIVGPTGLAVPAVVSGVAKAPAARTLSLSELLGRARSRLVASATVDDAAHLVRGQLRDGAAYQAAYPPGFASELTVRLLAGGADVRAAPAGGQPGGVTRALESLAIPAILLLLLAGLLVVGSRQSGKPGGTGAADPARVTSGNTGEAQVPSTRFSDVAGLEEAVGELRELVEFLRTPERFTAAGARLPRGFLLVGPPGTGKTLLARAVAGEAGVPFFALSGAEFVETYVGVGAARVRKLFERARAKTGGTARTPTGMDADSAQTKGPRAIVFIDEIDAIGKARTAGPAAGGHEERESTLNQLLVEMDGFHQDQVVVLAATNRPDILDPALLRPGRFDRQITVPAPDRRGRARILWIHLRGRRLAGTVDLETLARRTAGFTGADLANLVNQATLAAVRAGTTEIGPAHFDEALATVMLGPARRSVEVAERDRVITAWHEAGHALAGLLQADAEDPVQVTIVPRGTAGGVTWFTSSDAMFLTRRQAHAQLVVAMAGRAAEELHLGDDFTQGAAHDIKQATQLARRMVSEFGMSELGAAYVAPEECMLGPLADAVHAATRKLLDGALDTARALLGEHRAALERSVELLLAEETMDAAQLRQTLTSTAMVEPPSAA